MPTAKLTLSTPSSANRYIGLVERCPPMAGAPGQTIDDFFVEGETAKVGPCRLLTRSQVDSFFGKGGGGRNDDRGPYPHV